MVFNKEHEKVMVERNLIQRKGSEQNISKCTKNVQ